MDPIEPRFTLNILARKLGNSFIRNMAHALHAVKRHFINATDDSRSLITTVYACQGFFMYVAA